MARHYRDIDFQPAPPGWRMIFLAGDGKAVWKYPVPGWLIQEEADDEYEPVTGTAPHDRERRVIPAFWSAAFGIELQPADIDGDNPTWVLGPGQPDPTEEEIAQEHRSVAEAAAREANGKLAGRYFDTVIAPRLRDDGKRADHISYARGKYIRDTWADPAELDRMRAHFASNDE
ncbi:hypothetical protein [Micromonospora chersina]|uniref:hypothetical protein n=1 Tax=Micromonospora chersina TaxID=47854 RepID=UPI0036CF8493